MKTGYNYRTLIFFAILFFCLFGISASLTIVNYQKTLEHEKTSYLSSLDNQFESFSNQITYPIKSLTDSAGTIFLSKWYEHFKNLSGIYKDEFDIFKKAEVQQDLQVKTTSYYFVKDILVISPSQDSVISKNGWFTMERYTQYFNLVDFEDSADNEIQLAVIPTSQKLSVLILEDVIQRRNKSIICIIIDNDLFAKYTLLDTYAMVYKRISLEGETIYEKGARVDTGEVRKMRQEVLGIDIEVVYSAFKDIREPVLQSNFILTLIVCFFISILFSIVLTIICWKPLVVLVRKLGDSKYCIRQDPVILISNYIDYYSNECSKLTQTNDLLKETMNHFMGSMKNEVLFSMLTNASFDFQNEYIKTYIPWMEQGYPFAMLIVRMNDPSVAFDEKDFDFFTRKSEHSLYFTTFPGEICLIGWFEKSRTAKHAVDDILSKSVYDRLSKKYSVNVSDVLDDLEEIRKAYVEMLNKDSEKNNAFTIPIKVQMSIINSILNNQPDECREILIEYENQYKGSDFITFLSQVASEYEIPFSEASEANMQDLPKDIEEQLQYIIILSQALCAKIYDSRSSSIHKSAEAIQQFIEDNFSDPDLCVNALADHFSVHRTLISKIMKTQTGLSFSDFLLGLRVKKAKELLSDTDYSISGIAEMVGYTSYTSFKRAFLRSESISPKDYRISHANFD